VALQFNRFTKIATLPTADGLTITIQNLYNQFIDFQDELGNLDLNRMIQAAGKDDLGGGSFTVITVTLLDGWRLAFEAAVSPVQALVSGGNLVGVDAAGDPQFPIAPTTNVSVTISQATTGAILETSSPTAAEIWDYSGALATGGMGDFIRRKVLTVGKFLGLS
jgi:hypothetical protein